MIIKKKKGSYNDYSVELSWGQLNAVYRALEKDHADPMADELFAELGWYLQNVPGPGEDEEEYKEAKEAEKQSAEMGEEGGMPGEGRNPDLIGQEVGAEEPEGTEPPARGKGSVDTQGEGGEERLGGEGAAEGAAEADELLERPPAG